DGYKISTIFMTALPTHRVIEEAYRLGASFVLPKPFTTRALAERIHDALHSDRP
ncbi:response regulator, partial [Ruminococcaceae bacterium AF10-16]